VRCTRADNHRWTTFDCCTHAGRAEELRCARALDKARVTRGTPSAMFSAVAAAVALAATSTGTTSSRNLAPHVRQVRLRHPSLAESS
jgi:hypothetical protein